MTIKKLVYDILIDDLSCRNSDKKLQWEVLKYLNLADRIFDTISKENFFKAPAFESVRRIRQQLQREDLLTGKKLIQPAEEIKKTRVKMSKEKGYTYMQGKQQYTFNPVTQCYE